MHCYSQYHPRKSACKECELLDYCKESTESDPAMLSKRAKNIPLDAIGTTVSTIPARKHSPRIYTRDDMLQMLSSIIAMDDKTLAMLEEKIQNPLISLAEIGRKKNLTRQAVHKFLKTRCSQIPEIAAVFNLPKPEKKTTFMEAVCQIRNQSSELNSNEQKNSSLSCRNLICLNQNLDLSRLSIGKDLNNLNQI